MTPIFSLILCIHMGFAIAATSVIMARYWGDKRWWHIFTVGLAHLILTFSTLQIVIFEPKALGWQLWMLLAAYAMTDIGLWLFLIRGERHGAKPIIPGQPPEAGSLPAE